MGAKENTDRHMQFVFKVGHDTGEKQKTIKLQNGDSSVQTKIRNKDRRILRSSHWKIMRVPTNAESVATLQLSSVLHLYFRDAVSHLDHIHGNNAGPAL